MDYEHIRCDLDGALMILALNRPDKLNGYTGQMGAEITDAFQPAHADDAVVPRKSVAGHAEPVSGVAAESLNWAHPPSRHADPNVKNNESKS